MKCSFAKMSTKGTFKEEWPYGTDLYGRFLYIEQGDERVLIAGFDFNATFPREADRWRREVAARTGIPERSVWYHELQIHAAPCQDQLAGDVMDRLIAKSVETINEMIASAEECDVFAAEVDMGTEYSFNREQYVEGLGGVTVWRGMKFDENGKPYTQDPSIMLLRGYNPDLPVFDKPIYFDNNVDQMAYLFMFKNKKGETLGTVSRFAAHPDVGVLFEHSENPDRLTEYHYDYDWTGYLADDMAEIYGGIGMYINGPCADLATKKDCSPGHGTYEASAKECKRLASSIGSRIREIFDAKAVRLDTDKVFKTETFEVVLPMKEDIPYTYSKMPECWDKFHALEAEFKKAVEEKRPAYEVKRIIDELWRAGHINYMCKGPEFGFSEEELNTHEVRVYVPALRFCGYLFVGVPGESLVDMTLWLRSRFTGTKTVPIDQCGGYYNYVATPRSLNLGGYTYWSSWITSDAIPKFRRELAPMLDEFLKD